MSAFEQTTLVKCSECHNLFERGESEAWKRRCLGCWKRSKNTEKASAPDGRGGDWTDGLPRSGDWHCGYQTALSEGRKKLIEAHQRGYEAGHAAGLADAARTAPVVGAIDKTRVRQLLQLCHPDKHGGGGLAGEVTAWLLEIRKGVN